MTKSPRDQSPASDVLPYASPPQQARPRFAWFACGAAASVVIGLVLADAGNAGKGDYDWRAAVGIALVFLGIAGYFAGRVICKRPAGGAG